MTNLPDEKILNELLEMGQQMYNAFQKMSETSEAMTQKSKNRLRMPKQPKQSNSERPSPSKKQTPQNLRG